MDTSEFVGYEFAKELLDHLANGYRDNLSNFDPDKAIPLYANAIQAFRRMSKEDQDAFLAFLKVVISDTASTIFGILDGSTSSDNLHGEFKVSYNCQAVSDMQDHFLAAAEDTYGLGA